MASCYEYWSSVNSMLFFVSSFIWTGSKEKNEMSPLSSCAIVSAAVFNPDKASSWVLILPFLYFTSKSYSARRRPHLMSLPLGSSIVNSQCSAAWSVKTVNFSYIKYGLSVFSQKKKEKEENRFYNRFLITCPFLSPSR